MKIEFVTNLCSHYRIGLFELLHKKYQIHFSFFAGKGSSFYDGKNYLGDFNGKYYKSIKLFPKISINLGLIKDLWIRDYDLIIKCSVGIVPICFTYLIAKIRRKKFIIWSSFWHYPTLISHRIGKPFYHLLLNDASSVVCYGQYVQDYLNQIFNIEKRENV